jgi:hypothetical protein
MVWPDENYDRRSGVIVIGHAPSVLITTRRRRVGGYVYAEPVLYRAFRDESGALRPCNVIHSFYICYVVSIRYCARSKWGRNLWYEFRVCRRVTITELERIARRRNRYRDYARNRRAVLDSIWRYINAIASCVVDNVFPIFIELVSRDAGPDFVDHAEMIDAIEVLTPRIYSRETGAPVYCTAERRYIPYRLIREVPLAPNELGYIYRCRCPQVHTVEDIARMRSQMTGQLSLLQFMPIERLAALYREYVYASVAGLPAQQLEQAVYEALSAVQQTYRCVDASREFEELARYIQFVQTRQFADQCMRHCGRV